MADVATSISPRFMGFSSCQPHQQSGGVIAFFEARVPVAPGIGVFDSAQFAAEFLQALRSAPRGQARQRRKRDNDP